MTPTIEKVKQVAEECGAETPNGIYPKAVLFYPRKLQAFAQHWIELGRKMQRESDAAICDARAKQCAEKSDATDDENDRIELKSNAWQFSVLADAIRNNTGE